MKSLNRKVSTVGIFFAATVMLILYLLSMRYHTYLPMALFWIAIALMFGTIVYQSLTIERSPGYTSVVLLEIAVAALAFHLIYQIPYYGLHSSDAYIDMASLKGILYSGFVYGDPKYIVITSYFPMIHILGAQLSLITNIDYFAVVKWFPSLLDVALIPLLYLLVRNIFNDNRIALLSTLLFASLQHHIAFSSEFIRETIALVLAVCCLYLYFSARSSSHPVAYRALSIMCLIGTVFAHHLTSFMLLAFLLVHFMLTWVSERPSLREAYFGDDVAGEKITTSFLSIAFVAPFAYWTYVVASPFYTLISFVKDLVTPSQWGQTLPELTSVSPVAIATARGHIIFYGFYSFTILFALILLYSLLPRTKSNRVEKYSFTSFLFLCGLLSLISLYLVAAKANPDRFLMYGWLFGFAPLALAILKDKQEWFRQIGIFLLVAFMFFNVYMIDSTAWDAHAEGVALATSEEDYALANAFDFSQGTIAAHQNDIMAIYDVYNNMGKIAFDSVDINLTSFDWIIVQKEELRFEEKHYAKPRTEAIAEMQRLEEEGSTSYNRIYESNNLAAFKRGSESTP